VENPTLRRAVHWALLTSAAVVGPEQIAAAQQQTPAAQAQPSEGLGEIVVTGSRIAIPNLESISPVTSVTAADIALTGKTNISDVLNQLPQVFAAQGGGVSNGASGTAEVNLRNLGSARTLVLVDGRRLGPGDAVTGTNASDINQVPAELVERVEVLTGGASSTYGADAAAGVVNFIMRHNFEGVEVFLNYDFYNHHQHNGPAASAVEEHNYPLPDSTINTGFGRDASVIMGINTPDNKGNAEFYVTYHRNNPIVQSQYDYSACTLNSGTSFPAAGCNGSSTANPGRFENFSGPPNITAIGNNTVGPGGSLIPFTDADRYNFGPLNYYLRPDERWTAGSFDHYQFNEHFDLYGQLMVMRDDSVSQVAPSGAFFGSNPNDPNGLGGLLVNCNNPFLSAQQVATWCAKGALLNTVTVPVKGVPTAVDAADIFIGRRNVEGGNRLQDLTRESLRIVIGAHGDIAQGWRYDTYFQNAFTDTSNLFTNDVSWVKMQNALLVGTNAAGQPVCAQGGASCVPWNVFAPGQVPAGGNPYIEIPLLQQGTVIERVFHADVSGDLGQYGVQLATAKSGLKINGGIEWREDILTFQPDEAYITNEGAGQGGAIFPTNGGYNVWEGFIEAHLPLIEDAPYTKSLSFDAGYRYSSYNLGFNTNTYKFGLAWSPTADFGLRGSYNRAVRVPNIAELYTPVAIILDGTIDPCAGSAPTFTPAQCKAQGVSAAQYGNVLASPASQYNGLDGGDAHLQPEVASTYSFGFSFTPTFLPDFRLQVDYWNIQIKNAINTPGADTIKLACGATLDPVTCGLIHRNPSLGTLWTTGTYVVDTTQNIGEIKTSGIDVDASYRLDIHSAGRLDFAFIGTYTKDYIFSPITGVSYDCAGLYGPTCNAVTTTGSGGTGPLNKWRHQFRTTWETPYQGLSFTATWRFYSSVTLDAYSSQQFLNNPSLQNATDHTFATRSYLDLAGAWRFAEKYTLRAGINNILDKDPPLNGLSTCPTTQCNGNTWPQTYDAFGRFLFINLTADF
jgi:iron complex outermembrane recepter protein